MQFPWLLGNIPLIVARLSKPNYKPDTYTDYWNIIHYDILEKILRKAVMLEFMETLKNFERKFDRVSNACGCICEIYQIDTFDIHQINSYNDSDDLVLSKPTGIEIMNKEYKYGLAFTKIKCKQLNTALKLNQVVGRSKFKRKKDKIKALMKI